MKNRCDRPLVSAIHQTFILAYKENTSVLESALKDDGFQCAVIRQTHLSHYTHYSPSYLCLLNHKAAWLKAITSDKPTLIIEADFVPVKGMGQLPIPYDTSGDRVGIAWLYTCAPQLYSVSSQGFAEGFSTSMVAYIITPKAAEQLLELTEHITTDPGPTQYSSWDSTIDAFLRKRQFKNYLPFRNYGEHGGYPNLEHKKAGLSAVHRADVLYGSLAFIPPYAASSKNPTLALFYARITARLKGIGRLFAQRYVRLKVMRHSSSPKRLLRFALVRHFTLVL